jgi:hypothetical protein
MKRHMLRHRVLVIACAIALVAASSLGRSEIAKTGEPQPRPAPEAHQVTPPAELALKTQCWQHGIKIIDQAGLEGLSLNAQNKQNSVSFKRQAETQPTVFILPFPDGLCLVQPQP